MKVLDIIQEDRASGFINTFLKGIAWAFGKGERAKAIEALSEAWLARMIEAGTPNVGMPINVIRDPVLAADREIMDKAKAIATKGFRKAEREGLIRDIRAGLGQAGKVSATLLNAIKNIIVAAGYVASAFQIKMQLDEYEIRFDNEKVRLENGEITEDQYFRRIGALRITLGTQLTAALGTMTVGAFLIGFKRILTLGFFHRRVGPIGASFQLLNSGLQYWIIKKLLADEVGRKYFTDLLLDDNVFSKFVTSVAAMDQENSPFHKWYKDAEQEAEQSTSSQDSSTQTAPRTQQPRPNRPRPAKPGDAEDISDIDWSKQK